MEVLLLYFVRYIHDYMKSAQVKGEFRQTWRKIHFISWTKEMESCMLYPAISIITVLKYF